MVSKRESGDLSASEFIDAKLTGARFVRADLSGAVMRAVDVDGLEIESPWLHDSAGGITVNGVEVSDFVEAELDRRFPGRELRHAEDPAGLLAAWSAIERTWAATVQRATALPPGSLDVSVEGEWSFAETIRHLIMATDIWLGRAILGIAQPLHPIGVPNAEYALDGNDPSVFRSGTPPFGEVLEVRSGRQAAVRDFIASSTPAVLASERRNPWAPEYPTTVRSCLGTIMREEWEHLRFAVRDLGEIEAGRARSAGEPA